jgi:serine O-acetyltransferase
MDDTELRALYETQSSAAPAPSPAAVRAWADDLLELLFHQLARSRPASYEGFNLRWQDNRQLLLEILDPLRPTLSAGPAGIADEFGSALPDLRAALLEDAAAIYTGDPAAVDHDEVIRTYPGFLAIAIYRFAHHFHQRGVPVIPRVLTEYAHARTGIDIHPGASIGERFCIDHGTGIVIGETAEIGHDVKLYQGVTLGALSVSKELARTKRHPTVEDDVVIYASTTILGGDTVVGRGSVIGGNVWLLRSVPPHSRVHYSPGSVLDQAGSEPAG